MAEGDRVLTFDEVAWLKANSPAWRLLSAQHAPLILSFLHRVFVADNKRSVSATELASVLDDLLTGSAQIPAPTRMEQERISFGALERAIAAP